MRRSASSRRAPAPTALLPLGLLLSATAWFGAAVQWSVPGVLNGPDAYFHIRQAWLMRQGLGDPAGWFRLSVFTTMPSDLEYGFHSLLMPFTLGDAIEGGKLAAVAGLTLFAFVGWWVLSRLQLAAPAAWTAAGLVLFPMFALRMTQLRPLLLTTSLLLFGLYGLMARRRELVGLAVAGWTWVHIGYPLLLAVIALDLLVRCAFRRACDWRLLGWTAAGWLTGLLLHPAPWSYCRLLAVQLGLHAYASAALPALPFAGELQRWPPAAWEAAAPIAALYVTDTFWLIRYYLLRRGHDRSAETASVLWIILTGMWALALWHVRFVEYLVPVTVLASAFLWQEPLLLVKSASRKIWRNLISGGRVRPRGLLARLVGEPPRAAALIVLTLIASRSLGVAALATEAYQTEALSSSDARAAGRWLGAHARPGAVVVPSRWDLFPWLFFYDHDSRFLNGLDPIYSVAANPSQFWRWHHLVYEGAWCGEPACGPEAQPPADLAAAAARFLREAFSTEYLVVIEDASSPAFRALARDRRYFEPLFATPRGAVYGLRPPAAGR